MKTTNTLKMYRVNITNAKTNRTEDHYLIKVTEGELPKIETHIRSRYPHSTLKINIQPI